MKVSFVIPLYNRLDLTRRCLETLQATVPAGLPHEIILVDDGSTDGTRDWLRQPGFPCRVLLNESNRGFAGTNNHGGAAATGEYLALLNNDLELTPGWLEPMLAVFADEPRAGVVGNVQFSAATGEVDHAGITIDAKCKPVHVRRLPELRARPTAVPAVTAACMLVRRELFLQLRGFDEGFRNGGEDVDLCFRVRAAGAETCLAPASRIRHHVSASPGRKRFDEANSRRLAARWRRELIELSLPARSRAYLAAHWPDPRDYQVSDLIECALHAAGWRRRLPANSAEAQELAMQCEEARWAALLGPRPSIEFVSSLPPLAVDPTPTPRPGR